MVYLNVEPGRDDTSFVQTAVELYNDFSRTVIIDDFKIANVTCRSQSVDAADSSTGRKIKGNEYRLCSERRPGDNSEIRYYG